MTEMFSDAFHEDSETVIYGKDIFDERVEFHYKDFANDLPAVRCNDVSFMKIEELDSNCRNILAVANSYICYSVTSKRNLLRLIDSLTGEKSILRAHEANIADVQVSPVDHGTFASVDTSESTAFSHTFVWKRGTKNIEFTQAVALPLKACFVRAHPEQSNVWAICDGKQFSVFNTNAIPSNPTYSEFSMHYHAGEDQISDLAFTKDGRHVLGVIRRHNTNLSEIQLWKIANIFSSAIAPSIAGTEKLQMVYTQFGSQITIENLLGFNTFGPYFITIASIEDYSFVNSTDEDDRQTGKILNYEIKIWKFIHITTGEVLLPPQLVQSIILHLPEYKSKLQFQSSSLKNPFLECSILVEPKRQEYLVIASRKSRYAAILAINSNYLNALTGLATFSSSASGNMGKVIYHVTLLDFTVPIISMDVLNIVAREHHSSEEDEHVEISCYQENKGDPGSSSIQQYHITAPSLYDLKKYLRNLENVSANEVKGRTIFNLLSSVTGGNSGSSGPAVTASPSTVVGPPEGSLLQKISSMDGNEILARSSTTPRTATVIPPVTETKPAVDTTATETLSPQTMTVGKESLQKLQQQPAAKTTTGLEGLKKLDSASLFGGKKPEVAAPPAAEVSTAATTATIGNTTEKPVDIAAILQRPARNVDILGMLAGKNNPSSVATATTTSNRVTPVTVPPPAPAPPASQPSPVISKKSAEVPVTSTNTAAPASAKKAKEESNKKGGETKGKEPKVSTPAPTPAAAAATTVNDSFSDNLSPGFQPTSLLSTLNQDAIYSLLLEMKQEMKALQTTTDSLVHSQSSNNTTGKTSSSHATHSTISSSNNTSPTPAATSAELGKLKDDIIKELHVQQHKSMLHSTQLVKTYIDHENKKLNELLQTVKSEIISQVQESITTKLLPLMTTRMKEVVKETIKESVKHNLSDSFRNAFENSLLPAFQSSIDRLFGQINVSFENGLKSLILETETIQQQNIRSNEELENEVKLLQDKIITLETSIHELTHQLCGAVIAGNHKDNKEGEGAAKAVEEEKPVTPLDLLKQGLIEEAVRLALELKDVNETVQILNELTPQKVNASCSNIVKLCITQQLAADMSVNLPAEGIGKRVDWIKNLLLSLIRIPKHEMESDHKLKKNFRIMIQAVLESIQSGRNVIAAAQYDNGEDTPIEIPPSVETDLQLLEFLIENHMG